MTQFGVITEQGDLGLGFTKLNENDNKVVNEAMERKAQDSQPTQVVNEEKK